LRNKLKGSWLAASLTQFTRLVVCVSTALLLQGCIGREISDVPPGKYPRQTGPYHMVEFKMKATRRAYHLKIQYGNAVFDYCQIGCAPVKEGRWSGAGSAGQRPVPDTITVEWSWEDKGPRISQTLPLREKVTSPRSVSGITVELGDAGITLYEYYSNLQSSTRETKKISP
jgi:hypothetical protein